MPTIAIIYERSTELLMSEIDFWIFPIFLANDWISALDDSTSFDIPLIIVCNFGPILLLVDCVPEVITLEFDASGNEIFFVASTISSGISTFDIFSPWMVPFIIRLYEPTLVGTVLDSY